MNKQKPSHFIIAISVILLAWAFTGVAQQENAWNSSPPRVARKVAALDVPYVPTPPEVVDKMLEMAEVKRDDIVYDLGCGDGRIVVTAAKKYGARGVGIDLDPRRVEESLENVKRNNVEKLVQIKNDDILKTDFSRATVVTLYLLPGVNMKLKPQLQQLKPGTRIVSHDFDMGSWRPEKTATLKDSSGREHTIYLWKIK